MHLRTALLALAFLSAGCASCGAQEVTGAPKPPKPTLTLESFELPNGLAIELASGACGDRVAVVLAFAVGADHDPPELSGMAGVVERVWAARGARVEASAGHVLHAAEVSPDALGSELERAAAWMAPLEPTAEELARARAEVLEELGRRRGGDPSATAASFAAESVRPSRGGGWRGGVAAQVEAIDHARLEAHLAEHLRPRNARLLVMGAFDPADARARIESVFGPLPAGTEPALRDPGDSTVTGSIVLGDAPSAVALAVAAPATSEPLYAAFLVLASRLLGAPESEWQARYDPLGEPEVLHVVGRVQPAERPEAAAEALRAWAAAIVERPLEPEEVASAKERFAPLLGLRDLESASCASDPRALAVARMRRALRGIDEAALRESLELVSEEQLREAAALFGPRRTAAVVAGGTIR